MNSPTRPPPSLLVATDLSPRGDRAVARAIQLAAALRARLTVLHVVDEELPAPMAASLRDQADDQLRRQATEQAGERDVDIAVSVVLGMDFDAIARRARDDAVDLVILGAHREQFLKDIFVGTTAERVLRHGDRPTLVAKGPVAGPYRRILVCVDFSDTSRKALAFARRMWPATETTVLHVVDLPFLAHARAVATHPEASDDNAQAVLDEARAEMSAFMAQVGVADVRQAVQLGEPALIIEQEAAARGADLVILGTHGRTGVAHVMLGSVAERQLRHLPRDVLAVMPSAPHELPHQ